MYIKPVDETELLQIIDNLKESSAGWDGIRPQL